MKTIVLLSLFSLSALASEGTCHQYPNPNLYISETDIAAFNQTVEMTFKQKGFSLERLDLVNASRSEKYSYATKTSKAKWLALKAAFKAVVFFTPKEEITQCEIDEVNSLYIFGHNLENINVYTATLEDLDTGKKCTQTITLNKRANFNEERLMILFDRSANFDDDPAETFYRYFSKPICK